MSLAGSNGKSGAAASREISLACQQTMQARIRVRDRHGSCPKQTVVLTIQFSSMEHHAFHVPYLLDTTPEAAFHGQAVKTVVYLRVSTTQQVLGPEARTPEGLAGRLTARWQGGRNPALPRTGRFQDRHRQVWTCPVPPSTAHEHPRAQAEPLACISTRILSVPLCGQSRHLRRQRGDRTASAQLWARGADLSADRPLDLAKLLLDPANIRPCHTRSARRCCSAEMTQEAELHCNTKPIHTIDC